MTDVVQLDLFEGKILTSNQQKRLDTTIKSRKQASDHKKSETEKIEALLLEAGFRPGLDYVNTFTTSEITKEEEIGWGENAFITEVTSMHFSGGCYITYKNFHNGETKTLSTSVTRNGDKLECYSITDQYRFYKPSTLLSKLKEKNERSQLGKELYIKNNTILDYTVEKYKKLFPKAKVKTGRDYDKIHKDYKEFKTVIVSFPSGSYVIYRLGYEKDKEVLHKKFDAIAEGLKGIDLLHYFNNQ